MSGRIYNHKNDVLDGTEKKFGIEHHTVSVSALPKTFDLRVAFPDIIPPILDQKSIGSCASNELSNALRYCLGKEKLKIFQPSRLFIYYFTRLYEGSPLGEDTGISVLGGIKSIEKYGACSENNWPYDITQFTKQPPPVAIKAAHTHCDQFQYLNIPQDLVHIKQALFSGFPIVFGIQVYDSFESETVAKTGIVPMPSNTEVCLGGHCCEILAFCDDTQTFTCANSWNENWGQKGYFTIPYQYVLDPNKSSDFWVVKYFK